ncbi:plasmid recombination enzyme [Ciceribacter lividus]|uniref:Plasmid recombination enzyme n=1 Tax=Ciceribacter lividus TaxID=1197950 RepID=A0A6I7HN46_9HYPH|nr:plasmid recombination protein [Ciceribacter lividus]RCW23183.1 plasmid recombination enzyme [Ciceribacter lividus]
MAYQFARIEIFSRSGKAGRTTDFIFDEVSRVPSASVHVQSPTPPEVVYGLDVGALRTLHDERAAAAKTPRTDKNGKVSLKAIRKDQNTLATVIFSHPATMEDYRASADVRRDVGAWERASIDWLREQYGDQLVSVVRHTDESHPHLHAYVLPDDTEMRAGRLHPGYVEKNAIVAAGMLPGEDKKALDKRANRSYVAGLRAWLDDYHEKVAVPAGLTRLGAGKRRLTRAQWHAEKAQAAALKHAVERAAAVDAAGRAYVERTKKAAAAIKADAAKVQADADRLKGVGRAVRAVLDGARESSLRESVRQEYAADIEAATAAVAKAQAEASKANASRRQAKAEALEARRLMRQHAANAAALRQEVRQLSDALKAALDEPQPTPGGMTP